MLKDLRLKKFLALESASSIILLALSVLAMLWANSPLADSYVQFCESARFTINDGLMAFFFLMVGLELKRECLIGQLSERGQILLPVVAALGGMLVPAGLFLSINWSHPDVLRGWAIPVATDIAFALGVLGLFGSRIPASLRAFLLALAIFDDLGAIIIIALFYTQTIMWVWLGLALCFAALLALSHYFRVQKLSVYLGLGVWLWYAMLLSGIHPTLAGVIVAMAIPLSNSDYSPSNQLETRLHPIVSYFIMPIFALANAGVNIQAIPVNDLTSTLVISIVLALFIGKQLGVFVSSWLLIKTGLAKMPMKSTWLALYGVSLLCGIGFTMSLFLGNLSFAQDNNYLAEVRLSVIIGSVLSGLAGSFILWLASIFYRRRSVD